MKLKPVVGISAADRVSFEHHADAIERSGGDALVVPPAGGESPADMLGRIAALVVCGGPESSGEDKADRDSCQSVLLQMALEADLPVLCTGRGMQALNAATGGGQPGAVSGHGPVTEDVRAVSSYHRIFISPGSKLAAVVGSGGFVRVNSRHRRGLTETQRTPRLMASAYSLEDGVIEALESPSHRWVIGVQFQPELRGEMPPHFDRLFQSLVERAEEYASGRQGITGPSG